MKRFVFLSMFATFLIFMVVAISSCTKEGPAGPAGAAGADGANGENGIDGQDGTTSCVQCHDNSQDMFAKSIQWEASTHATGGNFERNSADCGACHTSQGFLQRMANGTMEADGEVMNPNPPNCYTCHDIHATYTPDDWALTTTGAVALWHPAETRATYDYENSNLCAQCHQSRIADPFPMVGSSDIYETSNKRYGPHHGPVANMIEGVGGYEVGSGYQNSAHSSMISDACITCHMATAYGVQSGGHQMGAGYEYHEEVVLNDAGCVACHDDAQTKTEITQEEINGMLVELKGMLIDSGIMSDADEYMVVPASLTADELGAVYNYQFVREDRSGGVHNYKYAKALLENSMASLSK